MVSNPVLALTGACSVFVWYMVWLVSCQWITGSYQQRCILLRQLFCGIRNHWEGVDPIHVHDTKHYLYLRLRNIYCPPPPPFQKPPTLHYHFFYSMATLNIMKEYEHHNIITCTCMLKVIKWVVFVCVCVCVWGEGGIDICRP